MPRFCNSAEKKRLMEALKGLKRLDVVGCSSVPRGQVRVIVDEKVQQKVFEDKGSVNFGKESVTHSTQPPAKLAALAAIFSTALVEVVKAVKPPSFGDSWKDLNCTIHKTEEPHKDSQAGDDGFKSFDDLVQSAAKNTGLPSSNDKEEEETAKANPCGGKNKN